MENWYVIQVRTGLEERTRETCRMLIDKEILLDSFIPRFTKMIKINGKWKKQEEILFRGYVFLITDRINELYQELKKVPDITKLLGNYKDTIYPLTVHEVLFLKNFSDANHLVELSLGYIEGDKIVVTSGPLQGREGLIKKIDRHKRIAYIELEFLGKISKAKVGLEIISKNI